MCITFCNRRRWLYDNHVDCEIDVCSFADPGSNGPCQTCQHRRNRLCTLTNTPLPDTGGCCHWNIAFVEGKVAVTPAMVAPLPAVGFFDRVKNILPAEVVHQQHGNGKWLVSPEFLPTLSGSGVRYQHTAEGVIIDPEQLVLAISEPVTQILHRFSIPYYQQPIDGDGHEIIFIDPGELSLPVQFGRGSGDSFH